MKAAIAILLIVAVPAFAADPPADLPVTDVPRNPSLELDVRPVVIDGQSLVAMDPVAAIAWTRGARACELERDSCIAREEASRGFNAKWFFAGAGVGVAVAAAVAAVLVGIQAAAKKSP